MFRTHPIQPQSWLLALGLLLAVVLIARGQPLNFTWVAPTNYIPCGYVMLHSCAGSPLIGVFPNNTNTSIQLNEKWPMGDNYFTVLAITTSNGVTLVSCQTSPVLVQNVSAINVSSQIQTVTNLLAGQWMPFAEQSVVVPATNSMQFFKSILTATPTNKLMLPPPLPY